MDDILRQSDCYGVRRVSRSEFFVYCYKVMSGGLRGDVEERRYLTMVVPLRGAAQN